MLPTQWRPFVVVLIVAAAAAAAVAHQVGKAKLRMGETLSWDAIVLRRATIAPNRHYSPKTAVMCNESPNPSWRC